MTETRLMRGSGGNLRGLCPLSIPHDSLAIVEQMFYIAVHEFPLLS